MRLREMTLFQRFINFGKAEETHKLTVEFLGIEAELKKLQANILIQINTE